MHGHDWTEWYRVEKRGRRPKRRPRGWLRKKQRGWLRRPRRKPRRRPRRGLSFKHSGKPH